MRNVEVRGPVDGDTPLVQVDQIDVGRARPNLVDREAVPVSHRNLRSSPGSG